MPEPITRCRCRGATARTRGRRDPNCTLHCRAPQSVREDHPCLGEADGSGLCRAHRAGQERVVFDGVRGVDLWSYRCCVTVDGVRCEGESWLGDGAPCEPHQRQAWAAYDAVRDTKGDAA